MAFTTPSLSLKVWNSPNDPYDHEQLATNWIKIDRHNHGGNGGQLITTASIADSSITAAKLAPGALTGVAITAKAVAGSKLADGSVSTRTILDKAVTEAKLSESLSATVINSAQLSASSAQPGTDVTFTNIAASSSLSAYGRPVPTAAETNLNILRGSISLNGGVDHGTGFTASQGGTGLYSIAFETAFGLMPSITAAVVNGGQARSLAIYNKALSGFSVATTLNDGLGTVEDVGFDFIAIGPA